MELRQQLEKWNEEASLAGVDSAADMDVAKRLLKHGIEALTELERLRKARSNYMPLMDTALAIRFDALDEAQAMKNHRQTLDELRHRGGLDLSEAAAVKDRRAWRAMTASDALCALATPNTDDSATLRHAAELLEADAKNLLECHNIDPQQPTWEGEEEARAAHDDALCTALRLRMLARRIREGQVTVPPAPTFAEAPHA